MRQRFLGIVACAALLVFLMRGDRTRERLADGWRPARPAHGSGRVSSSDLVYGAEKKKTRRRSRRGNYRRRVDPARLDAELRDAELRDAMASAWDPGSASGAFWTSAFRGGRSARRGKKGKVRSRSLRTARRRRRTAKGRTPRERKLRRRGKSPIRAARRRPPRGKFARQSASGTRSARAAGRKRRRSGFAGVRPRSAGGGGRYSGGTGLKLGSLYTARRKRAKKKEKPPRKFKPPKLADWIKGPLKPPTGKLAAPGFAFLKKKFPPSLPDGKSFVRSTPQPRHLEKLRVPEEHPKYARWLEKDRNRKRAGSLKWPHWHIDSKNVPFYHLKKAWGRADSGRWSWMVKHKRRWWTVGDGAQRLVRHAERWWWKTADGWFLLHRGEPWAYRHFAEWKRNGFIHPNSGTRIVYSADGTRVAVITPGEGSRVFDARTGRLLASFPG